jgi:hypothetical protein
MYCIEQSQSILHSPFGGVVLVWHGKQATHFRNAVLDGRGEESRAPELRSRWLKFADLAPNAQELDELADLSRAEQEHIKGRIDSSVKNYQRLKAKRKAKTLPAAA